MSKGTQSLLAAAVDAGADMNLSSFEHTIQHRCVKLSNPITV